MAEIVSPKRLDEILKNSYHYDYGRIIFVLDEDTDNERRFTIGAINEYHCTDEIIIELVEIEALELQLTPEFTEKFENIKKEL